METQLISNEINHGNGADVTNMVYYFSLNVIYRSSLFAINLSGYKDAKMTQMHDKCILFIFAMEVAGEAISGWLTRKMEQGRKYWRFGNWMNPRWNQQSSFNISVKFSIIVDELALSFSQWGGP